jgi:hypothetical protein
VEEERPARRGEESGRDRRPAVCEACDERREDRDARHREDRREESERDQALVDAQGDVRQEVVQGRAAALEHGVEQVRKRPSGDEEDEGLVLVRRPGGETEPEEQPHRGRDRADSEAVAVPHPGERSRSWHSPGPSAGSSRLPC